MPHLSAAPKGGKKGDRVRVGEETLISEISPVIVDPLRGRRQGGQDRICEPSNMFSGDLDCTPIESRVPS